MTGKITTPSTTPSGYLENPSNPAPTGWSFVPSFKGTWGGANPNNTPDNTRSSWIDPSGNMHPATTYDIPSNAYNRPSFDSSGSGGINYSSDKSSAIDPQSTVAPPSSTPQSGSDNSGTTPTGSDAKPTPTTDLGGGQTPKKKPGTPIARVGDMASHGAQVITGHPTISTNDRNHARVGDLVNCPLHGVNMILSVNNGKVINGNQKAAHVAAVAKCGAQIITGSEDIVVDSK